MAASEGRRRVVKSVSCECLQRTSRCASLATRFSGYVTSQVPEKHYTTLKCKSSRQKADQSNPYFVDVCVCVHANVIIYIAILYIPIFKIKYMWGREATVWKNGFLWLYFCFTKRFKPVKCDRHMWWASDLAWAEDALPWCAVMGALMTGGVSFTLVSLSKILMVL